MISLDDLNSAKASNNAHEFEYKFGNGKKTGIFFQVIGAESEKVAVESAALMAAERARKETMEKQGQDYVFDNVTLGKKLAALRLVGWKGIKEEFTPENAMKLCISNQSIADQVMRESNEIGNFIKL